MFPLKGSQVSTIEERLAILTAIADGSVKIIKPGNSDHPVMGLLESLLPGLGGLGVTGGLGIEVADNMDGPRCVELIDEFLNTPPSFARQQLFLIEKLIERSFGKEGFDALKKEYLEAKRDRLKERYGGGRARQDGRQPRAAAPGQAATRTPAPGTPGGTAPASPREAVVLAARGLNLSQDHAEKMAAAVDEAASANDDTDAIVLAFNTREILDRRHKIWATPEVVAACARAWSSFNRASQGVDLHA